MKILFFIIFIIAAVCVVFLGKRMSYKNNLLINLCKSEHKQILKCLSEGNNDLYRKEVLRLAEADDKIEFLKSLFDEHNIKTIDNQKNLSSAICKTGSFELIRYLIEEKKM